MEKYRKNPLQTRIHTNCAAQTQSVFCSLHAYLNRANPTHKSGRFNNYKIIVRQTLDQPDVQKYTFNLNCSFTSKIIQCSLFYPPCFIF